MINDKRMYPEKINLKFVTRMSSLWLAFGLFFMVSCTAFEQSARQTDTSLHTLQGELTRIDQQLSQEPENDALLIRKQELLFQLAEYLEAPQQRTDIYHEITLIASSPPFITDPLIGEMNETRKQVWSREQSSGIMLLQQDKREGTSSYYPQITAHFNNAIAILPDSLVTYSLLATTYYEQGAIQQAINTLNLAVNQNRTANPEIIEKLAWLQLETGNRDESVELYEQLVREHPRNSHYLHGLVNAYVISGRNDRAIERLSLLMEEFPSRLYYLEALFEQHFYLTESKITSLLLSGDSEGDNEITIEMILLSAENMEELFNSIRETVPMNEELNFKTGLYFSYMADLLEPLADLGYNGSVKSALISQKSESYLKQALELIENAAGMNPERMEYRYRLHDIYLRLGMTEEADQIERTLNL